jgi:hypothetical protein
MVNACLGGGVMKVLMGVDDSEFSGESLRAIVTQFRSEATEVLVLHVLQQVGPAVPEMDATYAPEMVGEGKLAHALVDALMAPGNSPRATGPIPSEKARYGFCPQK